MVRPSAHKVATKFRKALNEAAEAARNVFDGISPDDVVWRGEAPKWKVSFASVVSVNNDTQDLGGPRYQITMSLESDPSRNRHQDGVYADSYLFARFFKAFPGSESVLEAEAKRRLAPERTRLMKQIQSYFTSGDYHWNILAMSFGRQESKEWENVSNVRVSQVKIGDRPTLRGWQIHYPWSATVTYEATKKAPLNEGPFDAMSDRELDKWIGEYESQAPENFWMDGELRLSHPRAYAYYRDRWRKMSPRDQMSLYNNLKRR